MPCTYKPRLRDHLSKYLVPLPIIGAAETMLFLDNLEFLLKNPRKNESDQWHLCRPVFDETLSFDSRNPDDFYKVELIMEDLSKRDPEAKEEEFQARITMCKQPWLKGPSADTQTFALKGLYEATNNMAEEFGRGKKWYTTEDPTFPVE